MKSQMRALAILVTLGLFGVILGSAASGATSGQKLFADPDFGMSYDERVAAHAANSDAYRARYQEWVTSITSKGVNARSLPIRDLSMSTLAPSEELGEVVARAAFIARGTVVSIDWLDTGGSITRLTVQRAFKGSISTSVDILMANSLVPADESWTTAAISQLEATPVLFPGDEVFVFLDSKDKATLTPIPWTGMYLVRGESIVATAHNPLATNGEVGDTVARFEVDLERLLRL